jgi:hypothetical protein
MTSNHSERQSIIVGQGYIDAVARKRQWSWVLTRNVHISVGPSYDCFVLQLMKDSCAVQLYTGFDCSSE